MILRPGNYTPNVYNFVTKMSRDKQCKSILKNILYLGGCIKHSWDGIVGIGLVYLVLGLHVLVTALLEVD